MKVLIIGGVALGASTLARLKRVMPNAEAILFEKDEFVSFANCGLPYYLGGVIEEREKLIVLSAKELATRTGADVRVFSEVLDIDSKNKLVTILDKKKNNTYQESYDKLVLATGARPFVPTIEGVEQANNFFTLRNIADVDQIMEFSKSNPVKHVTIVGSGFIGVELAENMKHRGYQVTVLELGKQILAPFDDEMAKLLENELVKNDIEIRFETTIQRIEDQGKKLILTDGSRLQTDIILSAVGVIPETTLAKKADLEIGELGGIVVNEYMQTSNADIYAGGDAVEVKNLITQKQTKTPLAGPANRQGRLIADNISGKKNVYNGTLATAVVKVFDKVAALTGLNEKQAKKEGYQYEVVHIDRSNHASYYPGSEEIMLKVIFESKTGRILGAQAVGGVGTEKRIDVIATAIHFKSTVVELQELELSYAPPFSSPKDPVNIAGYAAENIIEKKYLPFYVQDVEALLEENAQIVDVRKQEEYEEGHIPGALHIPVDDLPESIDKLDSAKPVYVYCRVGHRGYLAGRKIQDQNIETDVYNLSGGYELYKEYKK